MNYNITETSLIVFSRSELDLYDVYMQFLVNHSDAKELIPIKNSMFMLKSDKFSN